MNENTVPLWLTWAREIQALAQTSYYFSENDFQRQRNQRLMEIAAEIIGEHSNLDVASLSNIFCSQAGYATPHIDVRGAVFQDDKLLMVREKQDGGWTMPGGWADVGDVPSEAAEREVWEEAGFHVKARKVVGVYDANRTGPLEVFHAFKIVFLCNVLSGEARPSNETTEVMFFAEHDIPPILSGERTRPRHIIDAFKAYYDPECMTVFD